MRKDCAQESVNRSVRDVEELIQLDVLINYLSGQYAFFAFYTQCEEAPAVSHGGHILDDTNMLGYGTEDLAHQGALCTAFNHWLCLFASQRLPL